AIPDHPAKELVKRLAASLACDIPECRLHTTKRDVADTLKKCPATDMTQVVYDPLDVARIGVDQKRAHRLDCCLDNFRIRPADALAYPSDSFIGLDFDETFCHAVAFARGNELGLQVRNR